MIKNVFLLAALSLCLFQSCDNDDNEPVPGYVSAETKAAFDEKYPAAKDVEWETRNDYLIVDFKQDKVEKEAWFDNSGTWYMTETDIPFAQLPDAVKTAFQQGEYSTWKVDDVDMIERRDVETVYVIETEQGNSEVDLYYSPDGILVKTVLDAGGNDGYEDFIPSQPSSSVDAYVKEHSWISTGKKVLRKLKYWMEQFAANSCSTMEALGCRLKRNFVLQRCRTR